MMRFIILGIFYFFILTHPALADLDMDISEPNLEITTGFTGDTLTVFGTAQPKGDIVIIVRGPEKKTSIHRKVNVMGLWLTGESVTFKNVPGYYNVASSRPVLQIADYQTRYEKSIGLNSLVFETERKQPAEKKGRFQEALIQNQQLKGLYSLTPNAVIFVNNTLFKTRIYMPSNVPIGQYEITAFHFQNGELIDTQTRPFQIAQGGLAGSVHNYAHTSPFLYGITVIFIALFSSFLAVTLLRRE